MHHSNEDDRSILSQKMNDPEVTWQDTPIYVPGDNKKRIVIETQMIYEELVDTGIMDEDQAFEKIMRSAELEVLNQFEEIVKERKDLKELKVSVEGDDIMNERFGGHIPEDDKDK